MTADLLARIYANPEDREAKHVYADALQDRGDPRGEFIAQQLAGADCTHLLDQHEREWIGNLQNVIDDRRYEDGFVTWARLLQPTDDESLATIRVLARATEPDTYRRVALSKRMRALRALEVVDLAMLEEMCGSSSSSSSSAIEPWPFTHLYFTSVNVQTIARLNEMIHVLPALEHITISTKHKAEIEDLCALLRFLRRPSVRVITLETIDAGNYRSLQIAQFLSLRIPCRLEVNDHRVARDTESAYLARPPSVPRKHKETGERYTVENGTLRIQVLGRHHVGYVAGVLENVERVERLELEPRDPNEVDECLRDEIWRLMNSPAPGLKLPHAWSRPRLPPSDELQSMPVEDLSRYYTTNERALAWEKIRTVDAGGHQVDHLILTTDHVIFCTETEGRLARKFTFTRSVITRVTTDADQEAPEGYALLTIDTPSGQTRIIAPEAIATELGVGWT